MAWNLDTVYVGRGFRSARPEGDSHVPELSLPKPTGGRGRTLTCTDCGETFAALGEGSPHGVAPCWACVLRRAERVKSERDGSAMKEQRRAGFARKPRGSAT